MSCKKTLTIEEAGFTEYWPFEDTVIWSTPSTGKIAGVQILASPGILFVPSIQGNGLRHPNPLNSGGYTQPTMADKTEFAYNPSQSTGISLTYWTKATTLHSNDFNIYMAANDYQINLLYHHPTLRFQVSAYGPPAASVLEAYGLVASTMVAGTWYLISLVYDKATKNFLLYLNTTLLMTLPSTFTLPATAGAWMSFSTQGPGAEDYIIDEIGISMKRAFSLATITWLYNAGAGRTWPAVGSLP